MAWKILSFGPANSDVACWIREHFLVDCIRLAESQAAPNYKEDDMSKCSALLTTVINLDGAIVHLEEHRTLHSIAGYESALQLLQAELGKAAKAYLECLNGPK
jgi:hypothetical protein